MPFFNHFYNSCIVSADISTHSVVSPQPVSPVKSHSRHRFAKNRSRIVHYLSSLSIHQLQKRKRSTRVSTKESSAKFNNYDMTILHEDELENPSLAMNRRRKKKIPAWANQEQLELAVIDQTYFRKIRPEDIFGIVSMDHAQELLDSIIVRN